MVFLKNSWWVFVVLGLISTLYFALRLPNLTTQPIFADEAIYIRWSQIMKSEPTLRFISLQDGKTPLFMWLLMPFLIVFKDPLWAGRFLSVLSGFGTLLGVFTLGWVFFNKRVGLWAAFLISVTPVFVFFDRMALVDSMFSAFSIWCLFFALLLLRYTRFDLAMVLGYIIGGSILVKTPGYFNLALLPVTLVAFPWTQKNRRYLLGRLILCWIITAVIVLIIYNSLRLAPGFGQLGSRNNDYIFPLSHLWTEPFDPLIPHLRDIFGDWYPKMITFPILFLTLGGIILAFWKKDYLAITLFLWSVIPFLIESALIKAFTLRYLLFTIAPLMILASFFGDYVCERYKKYRGYILSLTIVIILFFVTQFNYYLITNLFLTNLPQEERHGYLEDWTAGYGFPEIAEFLRNESKTKQVVVGTEGFFGTLPDGLWIYLDKTPNITIIGSAPEISAEIRNFSLTHPTFFVANRSRVTTDPPNTKLIKEYKKPTDKDGFTDAILLYRVLPKP